MVMVIQIAKLSAEGWYVFITMATSVHNGTPPNLLKKVYVYATLCAVWCIMQTVSKGLIPGVKKSSW